jgi:hypothetical protein
MVFEQLSSATQGAAPAGISDEVSGTFLVAVPETEFAESNAPLFRQITILKSAIRFLRAENTYLKAQGLLEDIRCLPHLPTIEAIADVPPLDTTDSSDESVDGPITPPPPPPPPSRHSLETRSKLLWRELAVSQTDAKVVDLTMIKPGAAWRPTKAMPEVQLAEMKRRRMKLARKVERHLDEVKMAKRASGTTTL